jgi:hypothetical protein
MEYQGVSLVASFEELHGRRQVGGRPVVPLQPGIADQASRVVNPPQMVRWHEADSWRNTMLMTLAALAIILAAGQRRRAE